MAKVAKMKQPQLDPDGEEFVVEDIEQAFPPNSPAEPVPVRREEFCHRSPGVSPEWAKIESALWRIHTNEAHPDDFALVAAAGLTGNALNEEINRLTKVMDIKPRCGSGEQLRVLKVVAEEVHRRAQVARSAMEEELSKLEAAASAVRRNMQQLEADEKAADAAVTDMEVANKALRALAPRYALDCHKQTKRHLRDRLSTPLNQLQNRIAKIEWLQKAQFNWSESGQARDNDDSTWTLFNHSAEIIGTPQLNRAEFAEALPRLKAQFADVLPVLRQQATELQSELGVAEVAANRVLDVYLPV